MPTDATRLRMPCGIALAERVVDDDAAAWRVTLFRRHAERGVRERIRAGEDGVDAAIEVDADHRGRLGRRCARDTDERRAGEARADDGARTDTHCLEEPTT